MGFDIISVFGFGVIVFVLYVIVLKGIGGFMVFFIFIVLEVIVDMKGLSLGLRDFGGVSFCGSCCFKV